MKTIQIGLSNILPAFDQSAVGTRVLHPEEFLSAVETAIAAHDFTTDRVPGQGFLVLPLEAYPLVSCGIGRRSTDPDDYVLRTHRGRVNAYLKRGRAEPVSDLAVVVYTREAYLADPDVLEDAGEAERAKGTIATHFIVAVLASAGPKPPLTPLRFLANLAGGNREAEEWSMQEVRDKAREVNAYDDLWVVVAD